MMWFSILVFIVALILLSMFFKWQTDRDIRAIDRHMRNTIEKIAIEIQKNIDKHKEDPNDPFINSIDDL